MRAPASLSGVGTSQDGCIHCIRYKPSLGEAQQLIQTRLLLRLTNSTQHPPQAFDRLTYLLCQSGTPEGIPLTGMPRPASRPAFLLLCSRVIQLGLSSQCPGHALATQKVPLPQRPAYKMTPPRNSYSSERDSRCTGLNECAESQVPNGVFVVISPPKPSARALGKDPEETQS